MWHPRVKFKSYRTRPVRVWYNLNLTLGCHRFYYLAPLLVLDPIYLNCLENKTLKMAIITVFYLFVWMVNFISGTSLRYIDVQNRVLCVRHIPLIPSVLVRSWWKVEVKHFSEVELFIAYHYTKKNKQKRKCSWPK
jgi:hypothetical protein